MLVSDTSVIDRKKALLSKIKALADRGIDGERVNAAALLEKIMQQHGIEEWEITEDEIKDHEFKTDRNIPYSDRLLSQIVYSIFGDDDGKGSYLYVRKSKNRRCIRCTDAELLEIAAMYEFYKMHLSQDLDIAYRAFIQANRIFPPDHLIKRSEEDDAPISDEQSKILRLARALDAHPYLKRITSGGGA